MQANGLVDVETRGQGNLKCPKFAGWMRKTVRELRA